MEASGGIRRFAKARAHLAVVALAASLICASSGLAISRIPHGKSASEPTGTIAGRVTDPENAPVPGVQVTAESLSRGSKLTVETRHDGRYRLMQLAPGTYRVTFIKKAFQVVVFRNIKVLPGKTYTLNLQLRVDPPARR